MIDPGDTLMLGARGDDARSRGFCRDFLQRGAQRFVLGRNDLAERIAAVIDVDGFIDEFASEPVWLGKPVVTRLAALPGAALVVSAVIGRPLTVRRKLSAAGVRAIDYFAFQRDCGLPLAPVRFWPEFQAGFARHRPRYEWLYRRLADAASRDTLTRVLNFRLTQDLDQMEGFVDAQDRQYFEPFLQLQSAGETFADVGSFDGQTALEFIRHCPDYCGIHAFEPEPKNYAVVTERLGTLPRVHCYPFGLSDRDASISFASAGSCSRAADSGAVQIALRRFDDLVTDKVTFIKMDIEGGEQDAIAGAACSIRRHHPRLAISAYHKADDLWRISEQVLAIRDDYALYLRHYTEGVDETVLFFIPERVAA